jgi:hypothetical protein
VKNEQSEAKSPEARSPPSTFSPYRHLVSSPSTYLNEPLFPSTRPVVEDPLSGDFRASMELRSFYDELEVYARNWVDEGKRRYQGSYGSPCFSRVGLLSRFVRPGREHFGKSNHSTILLSEILGVTYSGPHVRITSCGSASRIHPRHLGEFWRGYRFHPKWLELRYYRIDRGGCSPDCEKTQVGETHHEGVLRESL